MPHKNTVYKIIDTDDTSFPLFESSIAAGFPSPAEEYIDTHLNLHELMIDHPTSTFFIRVQGDSMTGKGIYNEDILVVDRSLTPQSGSVVVAILDGDFLVKTWEKGTTHHLLRSANPRYPDIRINEASGRDFSIWGVVTYAIHNLRNHAKR